MASTDMEARQAKAKDKPYKLGFGEGLYLQVDTNGKKYWRFRYRFGGKQKLLALGVYPETPLKGYFLKKDDPDSWVDGARELVTRARKNLAAGNDPGEIRKAQKMVAKLSAKVCPEDGFEVVAREWHKQYIHTWTAGHAQTLLRRLELNVFPWLGTRPVGEIEAPELLLVLRQIQGRGALETAHRVKTICGQVFRYAIATGRAKRDISADLRGALPPPPERHHAAVTEPDELARLLRDIEGYQGGMVVKCALRLAPLVFLRPGELRQAEWKEFDFDAAQWNIPAERMKMKVAHIVPLSAQAMEILRSLQPLTGRSKYVFPSARSLVKCMSDNAVNAALRALGYDRETMTGHGFRATARTILDEVLGFRVDIIEHQLAHLVKDPLGRAYNRTKHLPQRRQMMQKWADYLDSLKG